jgi:hypothetical protein
MLKSFLNTLFCRAPATPKSHQNIEQLAGDAQAYWSDSTNDDHLKDQSHWRGAGRFSDDEKWLDIGRSHVRLLHQLRAFAGSTAAFGNVVEWGPGGGSNALAMLQEMKNYCAIDISAPNLGECQRQLRLAKFDGFTPVLFDAAKPETVLEGRESSFDLFLSTAVFQHFPSKDYGGRVWHIAQQLQRTDGFALIQTRIDDGTDRLQPKTANYRENATFFTSYRVEEFWEILVDAELEPLANVIWTEPRYAFYLARKSS